ncbi:MAG TPA: hydrolase [Streptomyces sp.]|uniref:CPCC family cysteine-rich protein n=1 Tax=Streptomyces salyersiae TaxID=3075530 RepID=A0ABU2RNW4_9ACTN|nr:CPCC family cysteine-rich protein [Streptomyces sp. DSM 41770]MDT0429074.1 CPCC family cysteine-rich protein [Streptomyces sp. DSM 41770]HBF85195.1 hydrolase [Streptomyces sp.]
MSDADEQIRAELAELEALEAAEAAGESLMGPESTSAPPPGGWLPCPCCGHQMFVEMGSYDICSVCFWEEDLAQLRWPWSFGANAVCLVDAQRNYQRFGAMEERFLKHVRPPAQDEPLDPEWRPIDPSRDSFETPSNSGAWPEDLGALYWWRPTFWRRDEQPTAPPAQAHE